MNVQIGKVDRGSKVNGGRGAKLGYKNTELKGNGLPDCNREIRPACIRLKSGKFGVAKVKIPDLRTLLYKWIPPPRVGGSI